MSLGILPGAEHVTSSMVLFLASAAVGLIAVVTVAARIRRIHRPQRLRTPEPQDSVQRSRLKSGEAG